MTEHSAEISSQIAKRRKVLRWILSIPCALVLLLSLLQIIFFVAVLFAESEVPFFLSLSTGLLLMGLPLLFCFFCVILIRNNFRKPGEQTVRESLKFLAFLIYLFMFGFLLRVLSHGTNNGDGTGLKLGSAENWPEQIAILCLILSVLIAYRIAASLICRWAGYKNSQSEDEIKNNRRALQGVTVFLSGALTVSALIMAYMLRPQNLQSDTLHGLFIAPLVFAAVFAINMIRNIRRFSYGSFRGSLLLFFFVGYVLIGRYTDKIYDPDQTNDLYLFLKFGVTVMLYLYTLWSLTRWAGLKQSSTETCPASADPQTPTDLKQQEIR